MTVVPLPERPCIRINLDYTDVDGALAGSRMFFAYAGSAPSGANCIAIADGVAAAFADSLLDDISEAYSLTRVDVLDIASADGLSGEWNGSHTGGDTSGIIPSSAATNIEFDIARRYRGGKPRQFLPPPGIAEVLNGRQWTSAFVTQVGTDFTSFITAIEALDVGAVGALSHVSLSYYQGFTNHTNTSGRERAVSTYRVVAKVDPIIGYAPKAVIGAQRRRRAATSF